MKKVIKHIGCRRLRRLVLSVCMIMVLAGCGQDDAAQTGAEPQSDAIQTEMQDSAAQTENPADVHDTTLGEASTETEAGKTDGDTQIAPEEVTVMPDATNAARAQMEIDEETRRELTVELLEENHLDTSVAETGRTTKGCTFDLPEGFAESEEVPGMYVKERYPLDASTIYYTVMEQDMALQLLTKEAFLEQTQESLRQAYGDEVEVTIDNFESIEVSGYPAFRIKCNYQVERIKITQLAYIINADKTYAITYSQTSDYDYMEEYEASAATIRVQ